MSRARATGFMLLCSISAACRGPSGTTCTLDSDCESHFCRADGTCGPVAADGGLDAEMPDGTTGLCVPNHDGSVTASELPFAPGRMATFRVSPGASWNTAGTAAANNERNWDLTGALSGDADVHLSLAAPGSAWWASKFPTASYATSLSGSSDLIGVFHVDENGVALIGVVSPEGGTFRTELEYDPPARVLAAPITAGGTWMSTSTVSGVAQGVLVAYTERYTSSVDQVGTLVAPYGPFPALRVATDLKRTSGIATLLTKRTFAWVAECFGSVATVTSKDFETATEFSDTAEVRRIAP